MARPRTALGHGAYRDAGGENDEYRTVRLPKGGPSTLRGAGGGWEKLGRLAMPAHGYCTG
jgi:hypothetical protein